ncbi:MAG: hypothetical protein ACK559_13535, partial [bacterium]
GLGFRLAVEEEGDAAAEPPFDPRPDHDAEDPALGAPAERGSQFERLAALVAVGRHADPPHPLRRPVRRQVLTGL